MTCHVEHTCYACAGQLINFHECSIHSLAVEHESSRGKTENDMYIESTQQYIEHLGFSRRFSINHLCRHVNRD
jgi:hypothetical protein